MNAIALMLCSALFPSQEPAATKVATSPVPKVHKIAAGGEGGWDYLTVDSDSRRLYVSRGNRVMVLDLDSEAVVGELPETPGVHGIAVVPKLNKGFTSNGSEGSVTVFDLKTLKATGKIKVSGTPDAILHDPASNRVFTFNHASDDTTSIDPTTETVAGTLALGGEPEAAVADGKGHIFVNIRGKSEIAEFDALTLKILNRYPLAPGIRPNGLAMDVKNRRLFSTCNNKKMVVMDADKGTILATVDIGQGSDGAIFDPGKGLAYSSNGGDATVTFVGETKPGVFEAVSTIPTQSGARTMTLDPKTHRLYLAAATPMPAPAAGAAEPKTKGRRGNVPGSFVVIVIGD